MQLPPLTEGRILRRYKRFLADVVLGDGTSVTAHVPNTGSMATCWEPGARVALSRGQGPRRKLAWTLERVDMGAGWIGVHTGRPNAVLAEAIAAGKIPSLRGYRELRREVRVAPLPAERAGKAAGRGGRIDIGLYDGPAADALVEIKNATLLDGELVRFPDAVTERGRRHLDLLQAAVAEGRRGLILFAVNRPEGRCFAPAWAIDPAYGARLAAVARGGVEVLAVRIRHTEGGLEAAEAVPVAMAPPQ